MASLQIPRRFSLSELLDVIYSKRFRKFRQAFGRATDVGTERIGRAAPIKGVQMLPGETFDDYVERAKKIVSKDPTKQENWARGLRSARDYTIGTAGKYKGVVCAVVDGIPKIMSYNAYVRLHEKHPEKVSQVVGPTTYGEALTAMQGMLGYAPAGGLIGSE